MTEFDADYVTDPTPMSYAELENALYECWGFMQREQDKRAATRKERDAILKEIDRLNTALAEARAETAAMEAWKDLALEKLNAYESDPEFLELIALLGKTTKQRDEARAALDKATGNLSNVRLANTFLRRERDEAYSRGFSDAIG